MPKNAEFVRWKAPTTDVAGKPIDYELAYELADRDGTGERVLASFPGRLNPDGLYQIACAEVFPDVTGVKYRVVMRAFPVLEPESKSAWSNEVAYEFGYPRPSAPFLPA